VPFAREITAIDDVSDGRFLLGVGAGTTAGFDTTVLGGPQLTPKQLVDRFGEFLHLLDLLLRTDRATWSGEYYTAVDARATPGCVHRPRSPFLVAANGPRTIRLAARHGDGWITTGPGGGDLDAWWRGVADLSARLDDTLAEAGRRPAGFGRYLSLDSSPLYSLSSAGAFADQVGRAGELGFTDVVVHWPRSDGVYAGRESVLEDVVVDVLPAHRGA
jgi:alkanesulfonate monooxygenase SsuD/methylene tetrahydromethanopterin reductase-like flavin-dependent oxidoreductase (luciferase family)